MSDIAIRVEGLSKRYRIGANKERYRTLRDSLVNGVTAPFRVVQSRIGGSKDGGSNGDNSFWALKDVSFEIKRGEVVGIIGRNGAGKSTLLKILCRITEPTQGYAEIQGRVGSLLEVGTGFHPELTGRENVFMNGAILGMRREEIARKFDEIVAFSGVEKFIDTPSKHYSSGMNLRLGFSVAAHLDTEILLVDEVLAVGDAVFQKKCLNKMNEVAYEGRIVIFVSHNLTAVQNLCGRGILVRDGQLAMDAPVDDVVRDYLSNLNLSAKEAFHNNPERTCDGRVQLIGARVVDDLGQPTEYLVAGKSGSLEFEYENLVGARKIAMIVTIYNHMGVAVTSFDTRLTDYIVDDLGRQGKLVCHIPNLPLPVGQYRVGVAVSLGGDISDLIPNVMTFDVQSSVFYKTNQTPVPSRCTCMVWHEWQHDKIKPLA